MDFNILNQTQWYQRRRVGGVEEKGNNPYNKPLTTHPRKTLPREKLELGRS
jgi:hypothetical protein